MARIDQTATIGPWVLPSDLPLARLRSALSAALVPTVSRRLGIRVSHPDGRTAGHPDLHAPVMRLRDPASVHRRIAVSGPIGVAEAYQAGEWDSDDLPLLLTTMARHMKPPPWVRWIRSHYGERRPSSEQNTVDNARHNVARHYDLSNDFFAQYLDESMTYSSAIFRTGGSGLPLAGESLVSAQRRKIDRVLDLARVGPGTCLLEIGSGWGALAVAAARRGAQVHTITISESQFDYAKRMFDEVGVGEQITIELCDYRQIRPRLARGYDAIVSVEMLEAVGEEYWPVFFTTLQRLLARGGRIALQVITTPHEQMVANRGKYTWINKYVFPGGFIPSVRVIEETCERHTVLRVRTEGAFGAHYAKTLQEWRQRLSSRDSQILALGFDRTFLRTWELYLAYSEAGFRSGLIDVHHLVLERGA